MVRPLVYVPEQLIYALQMYHRLMVQDLREVDVFDGFQLMHHGNRGALLVSFGCDPYRLHY